MKSTEASAHRIKHSLNHHLHPNNYSLMKMTFKTSSNNALLCKTRSKQAHNLNKKQYWKLIHYWKSFMAISCRLNLITRLWYRAKKRRIWDKNSVNTMQNITNWKPSSSSSSLLSFLIMRWSLMTLKKTFIEMMKTRRVCSSDRESVRGINQG